MKTQNTREQERQEREKRASQDATGFGFA